MAVAIQKRAVGPKKHPIANVAKNAERSNIEGFAWVDVIRTVNVDVSATTNERDKFGYLRQIVRLVANATIARRASRSPKIPPRDNDPVTITRIPITTPKIASQVLIEARSPINTCAMAAAKSGAEAIEGEVDKSFVKHVVVHV